MRDKFSTYSRTTVRLDKDLDRFVEEVARVVGVQKAVVFREALYVLAEEESVLTQKRLAPGHAAPPGRDERPTAADWRQSKPVGSPREYRRRGPRV